MNGGSCTDGINSFTCTCQPAYVGKKCENEIGNVKGSIFKRIVVVMASTTSSVLTFIAFSDDKL